MILTFSEFALSFRHSTFCSNKTILESIEWSDSPEVLLLLRWSWPWIGVIFMLQVVLRMEEAHLLHRYGMDQHFGTKYIYKSCSCFHSSRLISMFSGQLHSLIHSPLEPSRRFTEYFRRFPELHLFSNRISPVVEVGLRTLSPVPFPRNWSFHTSLYCTITWWCQPAIIIYYIILYLLYDIQYSIIWYHVYLTSSTNAQLRSSQHKGCELYSSSHARPLTRESSMNC